MRKKIKIFWVNAYLAKKLMKKRIYSVFLAGVILSGMSVGSVAAVQADEERVGYMQMEGDRYYACEPVDQEYVKVGFIFSSDEDNEFTASHYEAAKKMQETMGLSDDQVVFVWDDPNANACEDLFLDCNIVFGDYVAHDEVMAYWSDENSPYGSGVFNIFDWDTQFCSIGTEAIYVRNDLSGSSDKWPGFDRSEAGEGILTLAPMHNFNFATYEARYVSGVVAGIKLNEMIETGEITEDEAKLGFVGAFPVTEVISGFSAFYLGARSVCPSVTMRVKYDYSWASCDKDRETAEELINEGCVLLSHHTGTTTVAEVCEDAGVYFVGCNKSMLDIAPNYALTSVVFDWNVYYTYAVDSIINGYMIDTDWCAGYAQDAVGITELNESALPEGTAEQVREVEEAIKNGTLHVFDTSTWTVNGETIETCPTADAYGEGRFSFVTGYYTTDFISDGYFHESEIASYPEFSFIIDGIDADEATETYTGYSHPHPYGIIEFE